MGLMGLEEKKLKATTNWGDNQWIKGWIKTSVHETLSNKTPKEHILNAINKWEISFYWYGWNQWPISILEHFHSLTKWDINEICIAFRTAIKNRQSWHDSDIYGFIIEELIKRLKELDVPYEMKSCKIWWWTNEYTNIDTPCLK